MTQDKEHPTAEVEALVSAPFAKLFDTPHGQLLAYIDFSDEDDEYRIRVIGACVNGVTPAANLGYEEEEARQRGFDKIDQAGAEDMALRLFNLVNGLGSQPHDQ